MSLIQQLYCTIIFNDSRLIVVDQPNIISIRIDYKLLPRYGISRLTFVDRLPGLCSSYKGKEKQNYE
jgi:hypothetical protein